MIAMHSANPLTSFLFNKRFGESCRYRANNEKKLKIVQTLAHYGTQNGGFNSNTAVGHIEKIPK